jgi:hypothetical protein
MTAKRLQGLLQGQSEAEQSLMVSVSKSKCISKTYAKAKTYKKIHLVD